MDFVRSRRTKFKSVREKEASVHETAQKDEIASGIVLLGIVFHTNIVQAKLNKTWSRPVALSRKRTSA